jgi:uncharacterized metal-binding protein YceD (DUF177 family)
LLAVEDDHDVVPTDGDVSDEPDFIVIVDGILDLTTPVRDVILLAVPIRPVAPEAADVEITTSFGGDDDIDPRWTALRTLRESGEESDD